MASVVMRARLSAVQSQREPGREHRPGGVRGRSASRVSTHEEHKERRVAGFPQYNRRENEGSIGGGQGAEGVRLSAVDREGREEEHGEREEECEEEREEEREEREEEHEEHEEECEEEREQREEEC